MSTQSAAPSLGAEGRGPGWYARVAGVMAAAGLVLWALQRGVELDIATLRAWLIELGPIAPLVYILVYAVQVIVAPIPGIPMGAAAGFVFGLAAATVYGFVGLGLGVAVTLVAGRVLGLRLLSRFAGPDAIAKWEHLRLINSPITWLLIFLGPSPDLVVFVAGMSRIGLPTLFLVALLGRAPAMVGATMIGAGVLDAGPWLVAGAAILGALFCFGVVLLKRALPTPA